MKEVSYNASHILDMNNLIQIVNVRTIFGHIPTSDNFWTEICLISRTSDNSDRFFLSETDTTTLYLFFFLKLTPLLYSMANNGSVFSVTKFAKNFRLP